MKGIEIKENIYSKVDFNLSHTKLSNLGRTRHIRLGALLGRTLSGLIARFVGGGIAVLVVGKLLDVFERLEDLPLRQERVLGVEALLALEGFRGIDFLLDGGVAVELGFFQAGGELVDADL